MHFEKNVLEYFGEMVQEIPVEPKAQMEPVDSSVENASEYASLYLIEDEFVVPFVSSQGGSSGCSRQGQHVRRDNQHSTVSSCYSFRVILKLIEAFFYEFPCEVVSKSSLEILVSYRWCSCADNGTRSGI